MNSKHSDIVQGDWIDRFLHARVRPYARLMRLDRPIGTWLLLWPCLWSLTLASSGWPRLDCVLFFAFGAMVMRGAGCTINDIYDRDLDGLVERTQTRPIVSGAVTPLAAILFAVLLLLIGFVILLQFNDVTVWFGVASLLLVLTYPLAKRITWWPQLVLGFTFNWGALLGWSAIYGGLSLPAICLYVGGIFWTLGYDTIYAHQDKRDDAMIGVKSLALYLGDRSRVWLTAFYIVALFLFAIAGYLADVGLLFYLIFPAAIAHATWQLASWKMDDPQNCLVRFRSNRDFGLLVFLAILLGRIMP